MQLIVKHKRVAVGTFTFCGVGFVCSDFNYIERAVALGLDIVFAVCNTALDA